MNFRNNNLMLGAIGSLVVALAAIVTVKFYSPSPKNVRIQAVEKPPVLKKEETEEGKKKRSKRTGIMNRLEKITGAAAQINVDAERAELYARKAACRANVYTINSAVERWALLNDSQWPKDDLRDIGRDRDYFPNGIPRCPVDNTGYRLDPETHRVAGHTHPEIDEQQIMSTVYVEEKNIKKNKKNKKPKRSE